MAIDTLAYVKELEAAGISREPAEAQVRALTQADLATAAALANLATKTDVAELRSALVELKYELSWRFFGLMLGTVGLMNAILFGLLRLIH